MLQYLLRHYRNCWFWCLCRLALSIIFLAASIPKFFNVALFKVTILNYYSFIPETIALVAAIIMPWLEFGLAMAMLLDEKAPHWPALLLTILSMLFLLQSLVFYNQLMPYGCGCFGFSQEQTLGIGGVIRNIIITATASCAYRGCRTGKARLRPPR